MPAHKKYDSLEAKKAADAKRKRDKRAADKSSKKLKMEAGSNFEWIHKITTKLANQIPRKANQIKTKRLKLRDQKRNSR